MIRAISIRDLDQIQDIHQKHYQEEFPIDDLSKLIMDFVLIDDQTGQIITAGGIRTIAEFVIVTNKDLPTRQRISALKQTLQVGGQMVKLLNHDFMHVFVQDPKWKAQLMRHGFQPTVGECLIIKA